MNPYGTHEAPGAVRSAYEYPYANLRFITIEVRDPRIIKRLAWVCVTNPTTPEILTQALFNLAVETFTGPEQDKPLAKAIRSERARQRAVQIYARKAAAKGVEPSGLLSIESEKPAPVPAA